MENKYHKLSYSKYFELAVDCILKMIDEPSKEYSASQFVDLFQDSEVNMFIAGYILGKEYTADDIDNIQGGLNSMSDILIKQYFEEALANG